MSELDRPMIPTSTQELADSQIPPVVDHPAASNSTQEGTEVPEPVASIAEGMHSAAEEKESSESAEVPIESEASEEILSDTAAMELIDSFDRNGPQSEPVEAAESSAPPAVPPVEVVEPPGVPAVLDVLQVLGAQVNGRLEVIQAMVERELRAEMTRERVVDRLHAELQEYKQDLLLKVMRPMFVDLIQLHDEIGKMADARPEAEAEGESNAGVDPVRPILESIRVGIEDILYRQGVEPFEQEGVTFDARRQRAITTVATEDPELNKTVAARIRKGFQTEDKIIRPEIVSVYTLKK